MKKSVLRDIQTSVTADNIAIQFTGVTKTFEQWQRSGDFKNTLKNLIRPEKKTITALDDITFSIERGEFTAYAGPNGAGKSTTIKLISGMLIPLSGEISVLGLSPAKNRMKLMEKVGVMIGNRTELWWDHPVMQSFEWKREVWSIPKERYLQTLNRLVEHLDIGGILHTFARELSLGQRMKADLVMTLLHEPELILLDEPTIGLDVLAKRQMITFLKELNREKGTTILVTSHDMDDLEEIAQRILIISDGKIVYNGCFDGLRDITSNLTHIIITTDGTVPNLEHGRLLLVENGVYEFEVDLSQTPIKSLLKNLSESDGIKDVEIKKAPIEQVIEELYKKWC